MEHVHSHVLIAANPKSGAASGGGRVAELREALIADGHACDVHYSLGELRCSALRLEALGQLSAVVSAGGDGTAGALANLLPSHLPLLLFPLGTENLLAKHLGITGDVRQSRAILRSNQRHLLDVGRANGKLFLVMLSCGFDAEVVRRMHAIRTGHITRWSYAGPILTTMLGYRFPQLNISAVQQETPGVPHQAMLPSRAAWLFVFNVPRYAAGLEFCPQADPTDGLLDACTFQRSGLHHGLGYLARLWWGSHQRMRGFSHSLCQRLEIATPLDRQGKPLVVPFQIDGDPGGELPLVVEVLPKRLTLLVPPQ